MPESSEFRFENSLNHPVREHLNSVSTRHLVVLSEETDSDLSSLKIESYVPLTFFFFVVEKVHKHPEYEQLNSIVVKQLMFLNE